MPASFKPNPGAWIIGYGYDVTNLSDGRQITKDDLDPYFPDNPVMLIHSSNHGAVLNSAAFKLAGISAATKTPPGGLILRKTGSQEPEGLIMETAFLPIFANMPKPSEEELLDTFHEAQQIYARVGVTTCQEGATHAPEIKLLRKRPMRGGSISTLFRCPSRSTFRPWSRNIFRTSRAAPWSCRKNRRTPSAIGVAKQVIEKRLDGLDRVRAAKLKQHYTSATVCPGHPKEHPTMRQR